jgi:hypothetical protein
MMRLLGWFMRDSNMITSSDWMDFVLIGLTRTVGGVGCLEVVFEELSHQVERSDTM